MVSTRASKTATADTGEKRSAPSSKAGGANKKAKKEGGKLEVGKDGQVGLKEESTNEKPEPDQEEADDLKKEVVGEKWDKEEKSTKRNVNNGNETKEEPKAGEDMPQTREEMKAEEGKKAEKGEDEVGEKDLQGSKDEIEEPKHGKLQPARSKIRIIEMMQLKVLWKADIYTFCTAQRSIMEMM